MGQEGFEPSRQVRCNTPATPRGFWMVSRSPTIPGRTHSGRAHSAKGTYYYCIPRLSMACAGLPNHRYRSGAHCERRDTGVVHDQMFTPGPRPRCLHYTTPCLPYGATKVLRMCYRFAEKCHGFQVIHNHCAWSGEKSSIGTGISPGPSIMSAIRARMSSMRRRQ